MSQYIATMSLLWVRIDDAPGPESRRKFIEQNAVALLSNYRGQMKAATGPEHGGLVDPASVGWLGNRAWSERVRLSGLWNSNFVDDAYEWEFLGELAGYVAQM